MSDKKATAKGRQRQEDILDAASDLLVEDGYAGLTTRKVAARVGIRLSNVQYYFASREAMLATLFERSLQAAASALEQPDERVGLQPLTRFILADQQSRRSCRMFWELWALAARDPTAHSIMENFYLAYRDALAAAIAEEAPKLGSKEREERALLIMSLLEGASLFRGEGRIFPGAEQFENNLMVAVYRLATGNPLSS